MEQSQNLLTNPSSICSQIMGTTHKKIPMSLQRMIPLAIFLHRGSSEPEHENGGMQLMLHSFAKDLPDCGAYERWAARERCRASGYAVQMLNVAPSPLVILFNTFCCLLNSCYSGLSKPGLSFWLRLQSPHEPTLAQ